MASIHLELRDITFFYDRGADPVFDGFSASFAQGWTGIIGPNGSGKTTLLRIAAGELSPQRGFVRPDAGVLYLPQRTDDPPPRLRDLLESSSPAAHALGGRLEVQPDWGDRWESLSHGERKRAQIAVALWIQPLVLAADEPTNHIDLHARRLLASALTRYRGVGLLVSHDRRLLNDLCRRCLFVEPPGGTMRPGGYTKTLELERADAERAQSEMEVARRELERLKRETVRRARESRDSGRRLRKRGIDRKDHDAKGRIDQARITGKDRAAADRFRRMQSRLDREGERLAGLRTRKPRRLGVRIDGARARGNFLFRLPAGTIDRGGGRRLRFPDLEISPGNRVAMTGNNGAGKSTLVEHVLENLDLPEERIVYLPQEIPREAGREVAETVRRLPRSRRGEVMRVISRLGSDPVRVLETGDPSPGELRKLLLALGMGRRPHLIVMDEPTNHLDLPSIECMESALAACESALLLVSHDLAFLSALTSTRWAIEDVGTDGSARLTVRRIDWSEG